MHSCDKSSNRVIFRCRRFFMAGSFLALCLALGCGAGGGTTSKPVSSTAPRISAKSIICPPLSPSFQLCLPGANFISTSVILLNGRKCPTTYLGPDRISAFVNAADISAGFTCQVRNPTPTTELSEPIVSISPNLSANSLKPSIRPTKVSAGSAAFTLIFGSIPIDQDSVIVWNGLATPTTIDLAIGSASTVIPAQEIAKPGYAVTALYNRTEGWITPPQIVNITLNQAVCDMVESPTGGSLLAIVPDTSTANPSSLIQIDPNSGQVTSMLTLGKNPSALVVASDKGSIYMGSTQSNLVQRLAWPGLAQITEIDLVSSGTQSLVTVPGSPSSILVGQTTPFPPAQELVIYDDGKPRGLHGGVYGYGDCIAIDESATKIYALTNASTAFSMEAYSVDTSGLKSIGQSGQLDTFFGTSIAFSGGKLYTSNGLLIDPTTLAPLSKRIDTFGASCFLLDPPNNRIYFAGGQIYAYDLTTLELVGTLALNGMTTAPRHIVRWGRNGLAVVLNSGYDYDSTTYVFQTDLVRPF